MQIIYLIKLHQPKCFRLDVIIFLSKIMQGEKIIRLAKHAGSWYPQNKNQLQDDFNKYFKNTTKDITQKCRIKAMIGPHAGYTYSGAVAAWSYQYLQQFHNQKIRVFLIGPSHHKYFKGCSLSTCTELETPFGNIEVDLKTIAQLQSQIKTVTISKKDQEKQHSLEMHLPFIKQVFGNQVQVVPIIVGHLDLQSSNAYGQVLSKYFNDSNTIFIISSDFCHWGQNFDYQPKPKESEKIAIWQYIDQMDHAGMKLIEKNDLKGFMSYLSETKNTICGENPIKLLMSTIQNSKMKLKTSFVKYDQSEKVQKMSECSVSYAASVTFQEQ